MSEHVIEEYAYCYICGDKLIEDEHLLCYSCAIDNEQRHDAEDAFSEHVQCEVEIMNRKEI